MEIFRISQIEIFWIVLNWKFWEFSQLTIFGILQIVNVWNLRNGNFWNFPNWNFPSCKFSKFLNCRFLEFPKLEIFVTFRTENYWNSPNWKFLEFPIWLLYVLFPWFGFIIYRTTLKLDFATFVPTSILRSSSSNILLFSIEFLQGTPCIQYEKFNPLRTT